MKLFDIFFPLNPLREMVIATFFLLVSLSYSQTTVKSIQDLLPYLSKNNVNVKLAPGTYRITEADAKKGLYEAGTNIDGIKPTKSLLLFSGNNSLYDFTGVTIEVETYVFRAWWNSGHEVFEVHTIGNDNVVKNLTLVDVGDLEDYPPHGAVNVAMDGQRNRVEGFHVTLKGSTPYLYGDAFGKGAGAVISHRKHSACLVRGNSNHVKNCTFIQKSYGHGIFMQAAEDPLIEGCYIEGELRTTDDMLSEKGTGTRADKVDFMTVWGYRLPPGYTMSLAEDGIRTYNSGTTLIDGVSYKRGTNNPTVIDCTIKNMRGGVKITDSRGTKLIKGCTAINCEVGFASGSGDIIDCKGDANLGPLLSFVYENGSRLNADITVLPSKRDSGDFNNASGTLAYVGGSNHNITFRSSELDTQPDQDLQIKVSGDLNTIRLLYGNLDYQNTHDTKNSVINNFTGYPIAIAKACTNSTIKSCGPITDHSSGNEVAYFEGCSVSSSCESLETFSTIQAEDYCEQSGIRTEPSSKGTENIAYINDGDWVSFEKVNFDGEADIFEAQVASDTDGGSIEIRTGSVTGTLIGTCLVENTGGWQNWIKVSCPITLLDAPENVFLVFKGGNGYLLNIDHFRFMKEYPLSITTNEILDKLNIYPNPLPPSDLLHLTLATKSEASVAVMSLSGQRVHTDALKEGMGSLDISHLKSGVYILKIKDKKQSHYRKIIKL